MSEVKRYLINWHMEEEYEHPQGRFVMASDYDAAQSELSALREQLTLTEESNAGLSSTIYADVIAYTRVYGELAALREELAVAKRNEHNSEVAYKAAIEKQEELREEQNELSLRASRLKVDNENYDRLLVRKSNQCDALQQRLADAERRNAALAELLTKGFNCMELSGGKYRITMDFGSGDECFDAYSALCNLCHCDSLVREPQPTESGASE